MHALLSRIDPHSRSTADELGGLLRLAKVVPEIYSVCFCTAACVYPLLPKIKCNSRKIRD
jgi:hypothetical protein